MLEAGLPHTLQELAALQLLLEHSIPEAQLKPHWCLHAHPPPHPSSFRTCHALAYRIALLDGCLRRTTETAGGRYRFRRNAEKQALTESQAVMVGLEALDMYFPGKSAQRNGKKQRMLASDDGSDQNSQPEMVSK